MIGTFFHEDSEDGSFGVENDFFVEPLTLLVTPTHDKHAIQCLLDLGGSKLQLGRQLCECLGSPLQHILDKRSIDTGQRRLEGINAPEMPPIINGGRRDNYSCFVLPRDKEARGRGLVLAHTMRFEQTTGILQDVFHGENEPACRVMLDSYLALASHCKQPSHRQNMERHDRRVPEEFVDPRNTQSYHEDLSVFRKVMALITFRYKFIAFLRATMDQDGVDDLMRYR
jgi:hypothetical protein